MTHPEPERRTNAPPGPEHLLASLTPEQAVRSAVSITAAAISPRIDPRAGKERGSPQADRGMSRRGQPHRRLDLRDSVRRYETLRIASQIAIESGLRSSVSCSCNRTWCAYQ